MQRYRGNENKVDRRASIDQERNTTTIADHQAETSGGQTGESHIFFSQPPRPRHTTPSEKLAVQGCNSILPLNIASLPPAHLPLFFLLSPPTSCFTVTKLTISQHISIASPASSPRLVQLADNHQSDPQPLHCVSVLGAVATKTAQPPLLSYSTPKQCSYINIPGAANSHRHHAIVCKHPKPSRYTGLYT